MYDAFEVVEESTEQEDEDEREHVKGTRGWTELERAAKLSLFFSFKDS